MLEGVRGGVRGCERWCYCQSTFLHCLVGGEGVCRGGVLGYVSVCYMVCIIGCVLVGVSECFSNLTYQCKWIDCYFVLTLERVC